MKRFLTISVIIFGLSFSLNAQEHSRPTPRSTPPPARTTPEPGDGWVRFTSDSGHFSVSMPESPQEKTETTQSDHGPYTTHLFVVRDTKNVYLIGWVDYDPSFNFNRQAEMEANRDNFVKGINATLISTHVTRINDYPVIEFTAETTDRTFKSRVYMVGRRPYQIVIGCPKDEPDLVATERFLNSFKVSP